MSGELHYLSISELAPRLRRRELSPVELVEAHLRRIEALNPELNAYLTVTADQALAAARAAEAEIASGRYRGPLHGVPIGVKDLYDTAGVRTTAGSKILADHVPDRDAPTVARLKAAGAIVLGKTHTHEFAYGPTTNNPHYGAARNPWNPDRVAGGSSGGSGAGAAAGLCAAGLGTDTAGSIRIPAACCGVVGMKPTYGRVSRAGIVPLCWSLDHPGPLARTVADAAIVLEIMAGYDPADGATVDLPVPPWAAELGFAVSGPSAGGDGPSAAGPAAPAGFARSLRVGVPREFFFERLEDGIANCVRAAVAVLEQAGARIDEVSVPHAGDARFVQRAIGLPEATAYHLPWLRERPGDYGEDVRARLEAGLAVTAVQYVQAQRARTVLKEEFAAALRRVDVIATPTLPLGAPPIGQPTVRLGGEDEETSQALVRLTSPANVVGLPAITVPCGLTPDGLPVGLQLIGRAFDESTVFRAAAAYEALTDWHRRRPRMA